MINPRKRQRENRKLTLSQKLQVVRLVEELRADPYPYKDCQIARKVAEKLKRSIDRKTIKKLMAHLYHSLARSFSSQFV